MKRNIKKKRIMWSLLILFAIAIGYAAISTQLKIDGTTSISKQSWNIYWENPVVTAGSVTIVPPTITPDETGAVWGVELGFPGDFYEFTIDAVNAGTMDAKIKAITPTITPAKPDYINYTITMANGDPLEVNHSLPKANNGTPTKETYKVRVEFDPNTTTETLNTITSTTTYEYKLVINYGQANYNPSPNAPVPNEKEGTCPGENCIYYRPTDSSYIYYKVPNYDRISTLSDLTNYSKDYKKITQEAYAPDFSDEIYFDSYDCYSANDYNDCRTVQTRSDMFLGFLTDTNDVIIRAFTCNVINMDTSTEKLVCLEGRYDFESGDKKYPENKKIIYKNYPRDYIEDTVVYGEEYYTKGNTQDKKYTATAYNRGYVSINLYDNDSKYCAVDYTGQAYCYLY